MNRLVAGSILVGIGIFSLLSNFGIVRGEFFLLIVGGIFLALYGASTKTPRPLGFLIPGCIVMGVGIYSNMEYYFADLDGAAFFWILGLSFASIHLLHSTFSTASKGSSKWALYVGAGLIAFGTFVFATLFFEYEPVRYLLHNFWPATLIFFGIYMIFSKKKQPLVQVQYAPVADEPKQP